MNAIATRSNGSDNVVYPETFVASEAEEGMICAGLMDATALDAVKDIVSYADFLDRDLGELFLVMSDMHAAGEPADDITLLLSKIRKTNLFERIGGASRLGKIATSGGFPSHAKVYALEIRQCSQRRRLANLAKEFFARIQHRSETPQSVAEWMDAKLTAAVVQVTEDLHKLSDASRQAIDRAEEAQQRDYQVGVPTGLMELDERTGGLFGTELTVLAARTSIGKTAFATQVGLHAAEMQRPTMLISLEMSQVEVATRVLAMDSGIEGREIKSARLSQEQFQTLRAVADDHDRLPFWIWCPSRTTTAQIRAKARLQKKINGLSLLIVDYISLVRPETNRIPRHEQVGQIVKDLKAIASELEIPVLALCQINRDSEGKPPSVANLKESGSIEEDANCIWLLHRPDRNSSKAELNVAKSRSGATGAIALEYSCEQTLFKTCVPEPEF